MLADDKLVIADQPWNVDKKKALLDAHCRSLQSVKSHFLGYQTNQESVLSAEVLPFLKMNLINLGDGYENGHYRLNAKSFERAVIQYYARLWHLDGCQTGKQTDSHDFWGYLTSMGSTEGNLCALWNAREYLSSEFDKCPVVLYSDRTHYSINKACRLLQLANMADLGEQLGDCPIAKDWPRAIPTHVDGSINIVALNSIAEFFVLRGHPLIFSFNFGTTFNGAFDDIEQAIKLLSPLLRQDSLTHKRNYWLHVDGALAANYMPFIEQGLVQGRGSSANNSQLKTPVFDFRLPEVMSISVSPYKWLGSPWPYGLFMTRKSFYSAGAHRPHYIGSYDTTISGSRSGFSAIMLWDKLTALGKKGLIDLAFRNETLSLYAYQQLCELSNESAFMTESMLLQPRIPYANILLFRAPNHNIIKRFSLCSDLHQINGETVRLSHLVILEHVTHQAIDAFVMALREPDAYQSSAE